MPPPGAAGHPSPRPPSAEEKSHHARLASLAPIHRWRLTRAFWGHQVRLPQPRVSEATCLGTSTCTHACMHTLALTPVCTRQAACSSLLLVLLSNSRTGLVQTCTSCLPGAQSSTEKCQPDRRRLHNRLAGTSHPCPRHSIRMARPVRGPGHLAAGPAGEGSRCAGPSRVLPGHSAPTDAQ